MRWTDYKIARERMVREQLMARGIMDARVLSVMMEIPRHLFLDREAGPEAYSDHAFPIGFSQTMSQPYMVAFLAEGLHLKPEDRVLEIGTGSGYQAAVLSCLARDVYTVERIPELAEKASRILRALRIYSVHVKVGDGALGWPEEGPFDKILLTAAAMSVPHTLLSQLREGGLFLGPIQKEDGKQEVMEISRKGASFVSKRLKPCAFVPLVSSLEETGETGLAGRRHLHDR